MAVRGGRKSKSKASKKPMPLRTQLIIIGIAAAVGLLFYLVAYPIITGQNEVQTIQVEDLRKQLRNYGLGFSPTIKSFEGERFTRSNPVYSAHIVTDEESIKRMQADSRFQFLRPDRASKDMETLKEFYQYENDMRKPLPDGGLLLRKRFGKPEANTLYMYLVRENTDVHLYICFITA